MTNSRRSPSGSCLRVVLFLVAIAGAIQMTPARTSAQATVTFVQVNSATPQSPAASTTVRYTSAQAAGDLNVVVVGWNDATATVQSVADTLGNSYQRAVGPTIRAGSATQSIYYAANIAAAAANANTVTVTFTTPANNADVRIAEYRGLAAVNPVDVTAAASGSSASSDSGTVATTSATTLLVGANIVQSHTTGPGASYTQRVITSPDGDILEDRVVTATGSYNATAPLTSGWWIMQMVAFKAATGDTTPPTAPGTPVPSIISSSQINLTWPAATDNVGVTGYLVERCAGASCSSFAQVGTPATASFNDTGLSASTSYSYRIRATDAANNLGPYSATASATTQAPPDTQAPTAPGTPVPSVVSSTQINLTWAAATDNVAVTGYLVERCTGAGCNSFAQVGTPATATFNDTGLTASTSYSYRVRATDAASNLGPYSATAGATTQPPPAIAFVQVNSATPQSPAASTTVRYTSAQAAGDLNVVVVGWNDATATVQSVADTLGNAYQRAVGPTIRAGSATQSIYYAANIAAAAANANTVTVTFTTPANNADVRIAEYRGLAAVNPVDVTAAASGSSASSDSGTVATTSATTLLVGANIVQSHTTGPGASYTQRVITSPDGDILEDRVVTATGSYNATAPLTSGWWIMQMVAFKAATGDTTPPTAPGTPVPSIISSSQINLTWPAATDNVGVTGYLVERCAGANCSSFAQVGTPATASFNDTGLTGSTSYSYRVRATDAASNLGPYSATASATTQAPPDTQAPTAPGTPVLNVVSTSQINLTWPAATDNVGVTGYLVERCAGASCSSFAQVGTPATTTFTDTGLTASTSYSYRVRATDAASNLGPYSATATASTQTPPDTQAPTAPGTPVPSVVSSTQINLTWPAATDNVAVTGYLVERCTGAGCSSFAQVGTPATATFNDTGLTASTSYSYRVRATDAASNLGPYSATASATTQPPPAIAFVQVNSATPQSSPTSVTVSYAGAQTAGNLNVVAIGWNSDAGQVLSVTDTAGNSYAKAVGPTVVAGSATHTIYYAANIASTASNTVTVTFSGATPFPDVRIAEYQGLATTNPVDVVAAGQGYSATSDSSPVATTNPNDLLVGGNVVQTHATGPGASFTQRVITNPDGDILEDRIVTATGSYNATAPLTSGWWIMQMVAFKAAMVDTTPPTAPGTPVPNIISSSQINLTWPAATDNVGVTGYLVERCAGASCSSFAQVGTPATASFNDAGLTGSTSYSYRVRATDAAGNLGPYSATASATTPAPPDTTPPTAPGTPIPQVVSSTQINLTWPAATDNVGVTGYFVERCTGAGCGSFAQVGTSAAASFNDTGLAGSTSYSYRVRATDAASNLGPYSATASATTQAPPDTQAPTAPGTPVPNVVSSTQINLTWPAATDNVGVTGYFLERCTGAGCNSFAQVGAPATASFNDTALAGSTSYSYRVRATDAASNLGPYSATASATTQAPPDTQAPTAPGTPVPNVVSSTQINLTWPAATDNVGVTGYFVERCAGDGCSSFAQVGTSATVSFNDTGLAGSTSYSYRVRATDAAGNLGPYSDVATASTQSGTDAQPPTAPGTPVPAVISSTQINLTWPVATDDVGVTGYFVERCTGAGCNSFAQVGTPATASFNDTGLAASTGYSYRVRATDAANNVGPYSATASAATSGPPDLTLGKSHTGSFTQGQTGAIYVLTVTNSGASATSGGVNVGDTLPAALTATDLTGAGWTCSVSTVSCTRSDALAAGTSYPAITLTVSVAAGAPSSVTNTATVGGGGEVNTANDTASDPTAINPAAPTPPVFAAETHFAFDRNVAGNNRINLSLPISGTNTLLLVAFHSEYDGGVTTWTVTSNGVPGTLIANTDGYVGGAGNQRFRIYYWVNPAPGTAAIVVQNGYAGSNELAASAVLLTNAAQTAPIGAVTLDVSTTPRTSESETVATTASDVVVHVIADALCFRGSLGAGESSASVANDGVHCVAGDGDASLWISTKPGSASSTTVSSAGWASSPSPSPRIINGVGIVVHGAAPLADTQAPTAPGSLATTAISGSEIDVGWTASTDNVGVTGYRVERCQGAGCSNFAETAATASATFADTGLSAGTSYSYRVRATDAAGNFSAYSNISTGTTSSSGDTLPPSAPGTLTASAVSGTQVNLTWGPATDNVAVTGYVVQRCQGAGCSNYLTIATPAATSFSDTSVSPNTTYAYVVFARDAAGNAGPNSNAANVTTSAINPNLVAAYAFDEGSGSTVADSSGHGNTGTITNAAWTTTGKYGNALSFDGASTRVTINDAASLHLTTGMTLEAWVNPVGVPSGWQDIIYRGNDNYYLITSNWAPVAGLTLTSSTNSNTFAPSALPGATWTHVAQTFDGTRVRLFVNGVQVATSTIAGSIADTVNPLEIGSDHIYGQYFQGMIDDVRIYNVALTPSQIQADMATPVGPP